MKNLEKYLTGNDHGHFLLITLGLMFSFVLGFGWLHQNLTKHSARPDTQALTGSPGGAGGPFIFKNAKTKTLDENPPLTVNGPLIWEFAPAGTNQTLSGPESQQFYAETGAKTPVTGKFEIDLYRFLESPEAHLHIRQVDHNELGFGGGFKIAFEIVETF